MSSLVSENQRAEIQHFLKHNLKDKNNRVSNPIRMGSAHDGGYVLNRITNENVLISLGIGSNAEFERDCSKFLQHGIAYDGTIASLPREFPENFHWIPSNVEGSIQPLNNSITINEVFENCRNLMGQSTPKILFKVDIEGSEYSIFESLTKENLLLCSQIVMELHNFATNLMLEIDQLAQLFDKLNETHSLVLFHGNNYDFDLTVGEWCVPNAIELTWVHKESFHHSRSDYPIVDIKTLSTPNNRFLKDISIEN